jgi:predicted dehydrogenase
MIAAARKRNVFLMEAVWTHFFPAMTRLRRWLTGKRIGRVLAVQADFGIHVPMDPQHRLFAPDLGGGALLDLGIYPISFASRVLGRPPDAIRSRVHFCETGVDDQSSLLFAYADGVTATLFCASRVNTRHEARIYGEHGSISIPGNFFHPDRLILHVDGRKPRSVAFPHPGQGMQFEADHVADCLRRGRQQSDILSWEESLSVMKTLDRIRRQWKLKYPDE